MLCVYFGFAFWPYACLCIKGIVHPKILNSVINYSPSCRSKPVRPSFIFRTQIKMFLMKFESSLTPHRQQRNCNVPSPRNVARTLVKQSMWHQWLNFNLAKLREYFLCAKKTKTNTIYSTILLRVTAFRHFGEYNDACARFPQNVINIISVVYIQHALNIYISLWNIWLF